MKTENIDPFFEYALKELDYMSENERFWKGWFGRLSYKILGLTTA